MEKEEFKKDNLKRQKAKGERIKKSGVRS